MSDNVGKRDSISCPGGSESESKRSKLDAENVLEKLELEVGSDSGNGGETVKVKVQGVGKKAEGEKGFTIEENHWFSEQLAHDNPKVLEDKRKVWEGSGCTDDGSLRIFQSPFKHGEIPDFVKNLEFVTEFTKLFEELEFKEKDSDLFQFTQSYDLNSIVEPKVYALSQYLTEKVLPFMKKLTGLPLNQTVDMFMSAYNQTDFLLCHDDELDSRRIAFIWYLSKDWSEECGGTLDLFSATDSLHPDKIVKRIVPEFNKFVFFEVGATSFHQVCEVLKEDKTRLALSGWFYGEPLPRPAIEFPNDDISHNVLETFMDHKGILKKVGNDLYLERKMYKSLNKALCEDSQLLIPCFLQSDTYKSICESIVEADLSRKDFFKRRGPVNLMDFEEAISGPSNHTPSDSEYSASSINFETLRDLFHSKEFLTFLEKVTEFPFTTSDTMSVVSSLRKYAHGSYTLLKSGVKQTGETQTKSGRSKPDENDSDDDEEDPNFVDVFFYFSHKWDPKWGGEEIYCDTDAKDGDELQLMSVQPDENALALVVRQRNIRSFTKYVNCLAKENVYFVYRMTFAFDGNFE